MKKILFTALMLVAGVSMGSFAQEVKTPKPISQLNKPYNENIDGMEQIQQAITKAKAEGKNVICQVGGNWCKWCLWFADYVTTEKDVKKVIDDNFVYIHVNFSPKNKNEKAMQFFGNPKLGYPFFVIINGKGEIVKVQESGSLEEGQGYNKEKVLAFFNSYLPQK